MTDVAGPKDAQREERKRMGAALRALRMRREMTLAQAAEAAYAADGTKGISVQAWQNYEGGRRHFTPGLIRRTTAALKATEEEFMLERARLPAPRPEPEDFPPGMREDGPAALIGVLTRSGDLHVRRFHHLADGKLFVQDVNDNGLIEYDLAEVQGVHSLSLRGR